MLDVVKRQVYVGFSKVVTAQVYNVLWMISTAKAAIKQMIEMQTVHQEWQYALGFVGQRSTTLPTSDSLG